VAEPELIESYALLGDMQTAALVSWTGSIDWLCVPRFDSPAVLAALLGDQENGHWRLAPTGATQCTRRSYDGDTLILHTDWETADGAVRVIDFMPLRGQAPDVVRIVEGISGRVEMTCEMRLRFDYGALTPWVRGFKGGFSATGGPDSVYVRTPVQLEGRDFAHIGTFAVSKGDRVPFVLTWHPSHLPPPKQVDAERALKETRDYWREWSARCHYDGEWRDAVVRSIITLKALVYEPTGGVVAAATTSLPEALGGERNWDYRYCWLRDASLMLQGMVYNGYRDEALAWREWLLRTIGGDPKQLRIMYGLAGERRLAEQDVDHLAGYAGSKPVRIGNAASDQRQLDVYGEILDTLHLDRSSGLSPEDDAWSMQRGLLDYLESIWSEPDRGLWEMRGDPQQYVHSKVMAWAGFDRAVRAVEQFGLEGPVERWRAIRDEIHAEVCSKGYDEKRRTFTQSYGSKALDAATLLIPQVGFLPKDDPRVVGTVETIQRELMDDGFVRRYDNKDTKDGFDSEEGCFVICTIWLADDLHLIGREDAAREVFERVLDIRNDVGLLAEQYDPRRKRQLGNVPQAYSHCGLVNTARAMSRHGTGGRVHRHEPRAAHETDHR
jgi:GH15 family glucan-1,4-alpha-glucosidase